MCFNFLTGRTGPSMGPQSSADKAAGGYRPPGSKTTSTQTNAGNPQSDSATPQGQRAAIQDKQTADRNTIRRADSYGSQQSAAKKVANVNVVDAKKTTSRTKVVNTNINQSQTKTAAIQGGQTIMTALNNYNKNKKTILGG